MYIAKWFAKENLKGVNYFLRSSKVNWEICMKHKFFFPFFLSFFDKIRKNSFNNKVVINHTLLIALFTLMGLLDVINKQNQE